MEALIGFMVTQNKQLFVQRKEEFFSCYAADSVQTLCPVLHSLIAFKTYVISLPNLTHAFVNRNFQENILSNFLVTTST